ncbi:hypothetical protein RA28_16050 [Ruegeria sp. ANG-S4]|nr:hypothetical protein RA28_16050 [Ruegeria sp. ANG-S4]
MLLIPAFIAVGIFQAIVGGLGLDYLIGAWAMWLALFALAFFRFSLPLVVGAYFGATEVLEWPWYVGLLCTLPGLIFRIPGLVIETIQTVVLRKTVLEQRRQFLERRVIALEDEASRRSDQQ